jgi:hypothetical protein
MLAENHSIKHARTRFAVVENSTKFQLEIIALVSSANSIGFARESQFTSPVYQKETISFPSLG